MKIRVGADTPYGVVFCDFVVAGRGLLIVETFQKKLATGYGLKSSDVEVLSIVDSETNRVLWAWEAA